MFIPDLRTLAQTADGTASTTGLDLVVDANANVYPCNDSDNQSIGDYSGAIIIAILILIFYALALWDRWMNLKFKEFERERSQMKTQSTTPSTFAVTNYGSTLQVPSPSPASESPYRNPSGSLSMHKEPRPPTSPSPSPSLSTGRHTGTGRVNSGDSDRRDSSRSSSSRSSLLKPPSFSDCPQSPPPRSTSPARSTSMGVTA